MTIELSKEEIKMLEDRRHDLENGLIDLPETKALLNRIYAKLGKEPRKRKQKEDLVALMMKNRKRN